MPEGVRFICSTIYKYKKNTAGRRGEPHKIDCIVRMEQDVEMKRHMASVPFKCLSLVHNDLAWTINCILQK